MQDRRVHGVDNHTCKRALLLTVAEHQHRHLRVKGAAWVVAVGADAINTYGVQTELGRHGGLDGPTSGIDHLLHHPLQVCRIGQRHDGIRTIAEIINGTGPEWVWVAVTAMASCGRPVRPLMAVRT